ncbi:hypothetical protein BDQ17DRAFT_1411333, partial [Cyathus striatus]
MTWNETGDAPPFRTGPKPDGVSGDIENQCLFLNSFRISLQKNDWDKICEQENPEVMSKDGKRPFSPGDPDGSKANKKSRDNGTGLGEQPPTHSDLGYNACITEFPPRNAIFHPLEEVNEWLLSQVPEAHTAVTHDNLWMKAWNEEYFDLGKFLDTIKDRYVVSYCEETKACTLEPDVDVVKESQPEVIVNDLPPTASGGAGAQASAIAEDVEQSPGPSAVVRNNVIDLSQDAPETGHVKTKESAENIEPPPQHSTPRNEGTDTPQGAPKTNQAKPPEPGKHTDPAPQSSKLKEAINYRNELHRCITLLGLQSAMSVRLRPQSPRSHLVPSKTDGKKELTAKPMICHRSLFESHHFALSCACYTNIKAEDEVQFASPVEQEIVRENEEGNTIFNVKLKASWDKGSYGKLSENAKKIRNSNNDI